MRFIGFIVIGVIFLALPVFIGCSNDDDNGTTTGPGQVVDKVWVDSISASANSQAIININMRNGTGITGIEVPLRLSGSGYTIDSASFAGGRLDSAFMTTCAIDTAAQTAILLAVDTVVLAGGEGIFASLYISLGAGAAGQVIVVDSALIPVGQNIYHVVSYVKPDFSQILPPFEAGKIVVAP